MSPGGVADSVSANPTTKNPDAPGRVGREGSWLLNRGGHGEHETPRARRYVAALTVLVWKDLGEAQAVPGGTVDFSSIPIR